MNPGRQTGKRQDRRAVAFLAVGTVAGFLLAASGNTRLVRLRSEYRLDAADPLENAPPVVAFTTVVLGGFRGLIADVLWLRAARMQEEGRFFELVQLADWITKLEPRSTETWGFHAWNMAYNVSIMMSDDSERWRWVHNGIELLARDGLRYNPADPQLYFELGWLFQHKIGGHTDSRHRYYKQRWAEEMTKLLGSSHPDFDDLAAETVRRDRMTREYGLSPERMREVDDKYGPLDWRMPETHAVYWAHLGQQVESYLPCARMIYQSLAVLFMRGRLTRDATTGIVVAAPNPEILPAVLAAYEAALRDYPVKSVRESYAAFLHMAVQLLDKMERDEDARRVFHRLHRVFPSQDTAAGYEVFVRRAKEGLPE